MATETVTLNCARIQKPDLAVIDQIARIQLGAQRGGCELRLARPSDELVGLIEFAGLGEVLGVEVKGHSEEWEEPGRVEEKGELADPTV